MKRCKFTDEYAIQVRASVFGCLLSCVVGLGQIAYGIWLVLHNLRLAGLFGKTHLNATWGFVGCGGYASFIALLGAVFYILRRRRLVILHLFLTLLSILSLCVVWTIIFIEQRKVASELPSRLQLAENRNYYDFIDYQYNCNLRNSTAEQQRIEFQRCASFLMRQTWIQVYALLGMCGALICVQSVLVLMGGMMSKLLKYVDHRRTHPIRATNPIVINVNPQIEVTEEDVQGEASLEMTHVQPSAPPRVLPSSSPSPSQSFIHVKSPPFNPKDGFALSYSNNSTVHHLRPQRQQSITQL